MVPQLPLQTRTAGVPASYDGSLETSDPGRASGVRTQSSAVQCVHSRPAAGVPVSHSSICGRYHPLRADTSAQVVLDKLAVSFEQIKTFCEDHDMLINAAKTQLLLMKAPSKKLPDDDQNCP